MPAFIARATRAIALFVSAFVLASCGGGGGSSATPGPTGTVAGQVVSSTTGTGLSGVTVTAAGKTATTSSNGTYTLGSVGVGSTVVVKFALNGYAPSYQTVAVAADTTVRAGTRLTAVGATSTIAAAAGGTVTTPTGPAQVVLPAAGFVNKATGAAATGQVTVDITPINPAADAANMPGDYRARGADNSAQTIESFGAVAIDLSDAAGNRLDLASGKTATIRIPVATRSTDALPATIPLYYFDDAAGLWVQQGTATLGGTAPNQYYEGSVSHFTVWNADRPTETIYVRGCVSKSNGSPATDASVSTDGVDYSGSSFGFTDASGNFAVPIRKGGIASVYADSPDGSSNIVIVGPSQVDITLPACLRLGQPGAPVIVTQPAPASTTEGGFAQFTVIARGAQPLRYQWQKNGAAISGETFNFLLRSPVGGADNGARYSVLVTNDYGSVTSDIVTLTVSVTDPAILSGPTSQTVTVGATATFSVVTQQPASVLSFQWRKNGAAIAGATAPSYTTPATTALNNGDRYSVVVTNTKSSVTSADAVLTVVSPTAPSITQQPANATVTTGQGALFQVQAAGSPPLSYQWKKNDIAIPGATASSYTTPATVLGDSGAVFTVIVSNAVNSVTSSPATLTVVDPTFAPQITQQPQSVAKLSGQTATFSVTATGTAPLSYQWLRNGTVITGATGTSYTTPVLVLADDNTSYTVRVSNTAGSVTSNPAVLTVTAAPVGPTITAQPQSTSVVAGLTATFGVSASGTAPITFQWRRNGTNIAAATGSSYTTPTLAVSDSGAIYSVVVSNGVGSVTSADATLTVTPSQTGAGRYLVAQAGPPVTTSIIWGGNGGSATLESQAILAASSLSPTGAAVIEPAGAATDPFGQVIAGASAGGQISDLHTRYSLYFKLSDTRLYKIDHQVASGSPAGTLLSTLKATDVCRGTGGQPDLAEQITDDLASPDASWRFFAAPVAGDCSSPSDAYLAVRMGMSATDAPVPVGEPLTPIYNGSGAITGYIVRSGSAFQKLDANLANPTTLFTLAPSGLVSYGPSFGTAAPGIWFFFNGGQLYGYNLATTPSAPTVIATLNAGETIGEVVSDGDTAYVSIVAGSTTGGYRILRVSSALTTTPVLTGSDSLNSFALTPTRIVTLTAPPGPLSAFASQVTSVLRNGGGSVNVSGTSSGSYTVFMFTAAENVYLYDFLVNPTTFQPTGVRTRIVNSDGTNAQALANTSLVGFLRPATLPLVRTLSNEPSGIVLVEGVAADLSASGGTVRSVNAATRAPLFTYGTLQATPAAAFGPITIDPLQYGQPGLFVFSPSSSSTNTTDLYFLDSDTAGSLTKLTSFVAVSGRPAPAAVVRAPGKPAGGVPTAKSERARLTRQSALAR